MLRVTIFAVLTVVLVAVSRASLTAPGSHGFYRFFAWECILALFCLNFIDLDQWFGDPFSIRQLVSWFLLIGAIVPAIEGVRLLLTLGTPDARRKDDGTLLWVEKTTQLVTTGAYQYIRHPMYSSLLLLAWGVFFKRPSWISGAVVLAATGFLVATAKVEERENIRYFGDRYRTYMRHTRMFLPLVL